LRLPSLRACPSVVALFTGHPPFVLFGGPLFAWGGTFAALYRVLSRPQA
jgi:hypothetical protein